MDKLNDGVRRCDGLDDWEMLDVTRERLFELESGDDDKDCELLNDLGRADLLEEFVVAKDREKDDDSVKQSQQVPVTPKSVITAFVTLQFGPVACDDL